MKKQIEGSKYLVIKAEHRAGGRNWFNGEIEQRGIEVSLSTKEIEDLGNGMISTRYCPTDSMNFRFLVHEYKRMNQKKIEKVNNYIEKNIDFIYDLYQNNDKIGILNFINDNVKL
jgi:hypothetical protein